VSAPFDTYRTADGLLAVAVASDAVFARFAALVGRPDLPADPRFRDDTARAARVEELREIAENWCAGLATEVALDLARAAGVPAAPLWDLAEAVECEQIRHRGLVGAFDHPVLGRTPFLRQPVRFEEGSAPVPMGEDRATGTAPSPALGEDAQGVLGDWLGPDVRPVREVRDRSESGDVSGISDGTASQSLEPGPASGV
jgi:crotonobetainyl-CoA:carnitine CoA-transferase CaiB-like acyl-CoA transferase